MMLCLQSKAQDALVTSGGEANGSNGTLSYSIGQTFTEFQTGTSASISQGVQQPLMFITTIGFYFEPTSLKISVFPNPTANFVTLDVGQLDYSDLKVHLYDVHGKLIQKVGVKEATTKIQMPNLSNSTYVLKVLEKGREVRTFIIVKN